MTNRLLSPWRALLKVPHITSSSGVRYASYIAYKSTISRLDSYFDLADLDSSDEFINRLKYFNLPNDQIYTVYCKVRYNMYEFGPPMLGDQFGFYYDSSEKLQDLYEIVSNKFEEFLGDYNFTAECITYLQVNFRLVDKKVYSNIILNENKSVALGPQPCPALPKKRFALLENH